MISKPHYPYDRIIESRENFFRVLLFTSLPTLCFIFLAPRLENETTINAWVGVFGYSRAATWMGLPAYQNFLNFGSALPLMSSVSLSPLTPLGGLLPVQIVQNTALTISTLLGAHFILKTAFVQRHIVYQKTFVAALLLYPMTHYFFANDWTEFVLGAHGFAILSCVLLSLFVDQNQPDNSTSSALWAGMSLLTLTHLGYVGALLFPLLLLSAAMGFKVTFRTIWRSRRLRRTILTLLVLVSGVWSSQLLHLMGLGITNNARPTPFQNFATDIATLGFSESFRQFEGFQPLQAIRHLPYNRSLFLIWPAVLVILWVTVLRNRNGRYAGIEKVFLRRITVAIFMTALFAIFGNAVSYPLRPSSEYLYRDAIAILLLLMLGVAFRPKTWGRAKLTDSQIVVVHNYCGNPATAVSLLVLMASFVVGQVLPLWSGGEDNSAVYPICSEIPRHEVVWVRQAIWEATQPDNFFKPSECSLFQMVGADLYSVGAFLKIRQTSSDGEPSDDLQNIVGDPDLGLIPKGSIQRLWLERDNVLEMLDFGSRVGVEDARYFATVDRCNSSNCVLDVSDIREGRINDILWNYDPNLVASPDVKLAKTSDGYIQFSATEQSALQIRYKPPIEQKVSILAAWILFLVAPICILARTFVCRFRLFGSLRIWKNFCPPRITDIPRRRRQDSLPRA